MRASIPVMQAHAHTIATGKLIVSFPAMIMAACTAVIFLAAAALCIFLLLRPLLKVSNTPSFTSQPVLRLHYLALFLHLSFNLCCSYCDTKPFATIFG